MTGPRHKSSRVVIVGGGFAGLSVAARLAQSGLPVTLLESARLGFHASTRNQGWLYSGAWFALEQTELARMCYASLEQTLRFCPDCVEPQHEGMAYLISKPDTPVRSWTNAWTKAGIPFEELPRSRLHTRIPDLELSEVQHAFLLPDRSIRTDVLLCKLAATAQNAGAEIRTETPVARLMRDGDHVIGVTTSEGEEIHAGLVILAAGASGSQFWSEIMPTKAGSQPGYCLVALKSHLLAVKPGVGTLPFCVVDRDGLNHVPHAPTSVFGANRWSVVSDPSDRHIVAEEIHQLWEHVSRFFPRLREDCEVAEWAGTTVQAMHYDQIQPGRVPLPTVIDHEQESPPVFDLLSVYPGRATLWSHMAEETRRVVLDKLAVTPTTIAQPPWSVTC